MDLVLRRRKLVEAVVEDGDARELAYDLAVLLEDLRQLDKPAAHRREANLAKAWSQTLAWVGEWVRFYRGLPVDQQTQLVEWLLNGAPEVPEQRPSTPKIEATAS